mgnify:FL=1
MSTCPACNGIIGRDCFNPQECMEITQSQAARFREQQECHEWAKLRHDNHQLNEHVDHLRTIIACTADLVNSWCRESGVDECRNPWEPLALRDTVDRLWSKMSEKNHRQHDSPINYAE